MTVSSDVSVVRRISNYYCTSIERKQFKAVSKTDEG